MIRKNPRAISLEILNRIEETDRHPDSLLSDSFKRYRNLTPLDWAFITELIYGVLRWRGKLDWTIRNSSKLSFEKIDLPTLNILRLGLYQILFLSKVPPHAAVNESVMLAKRIRGQRGGGFVNAILRSVLRDKKGISYPDIKENPALHIAVTESHPLWLVKRWIEELGLEETLRLCKVNNQIPPLTLRVNTLKVTRGELIKLFEEKGLKVTPTHFSDEGIRLDDHLSVSRLPFLKEGFFIIQDEASQLVTAILDPKSGERILDACSSPGGKTTHIAQRMKNRGEIYAFDLNQKKLNLVEEGCQRLGIGMVKTMKVDVSKPFLLQKDLKFDRVLVDAPCTGFGTLRRNPDLKWRRHEEDIKRLSLLQSLILNNCSEAVREGGILVYSTCTVFHEENEDVIEAFLKEHTEFRLDELKKILPEKFLPFTQNGYFKTFPPVEEMDCFFVARMMKVKKSSS